MSPGSTFTREYGCTLTEWQRWMEGGATQALPRVSGPGATLRLRLPSGELQLDWRELEPRAIARVRIPRLEVTFRFVEVAAADRHAFLTTFDRHLQRGGG